MIWLSEYEKSNEGHLPIPLRSVKYRDDGLASARLRFISSYSKRKDGIDNNVRLYTRATRVQTEASLSSVVTGGAGGAEVVERGETPQPWYNSPCIKPFTQLRNVVLRTEYPCA